MSRRAAAAGLLLALACLVFGYQAGKAAGPASRPTPSFAPVHVPASEIREAVGAGDTTLTTVEPAPGSSDTASLILEPDLSTPIPRSAVEQPEGELRIVTPKPVVVDPPKGYAGWHRDPSVSWFGPGFYGQRTACGQTLTEGLQGVAHKSLPCGTLVTFRNAAGVEVTVPVVDRGPYVAGRQWDLTGATCLALDHCWTGPLDWRLK